MTLLTDLLDQSRLIPIIQADSAAAAVAAARAIHQGGIGQVEVVLRNAQALECIKAIRSEVPGVRVGAGTVLSGQQARAVREAGAQFIVTPTTTDTLLAELLDTGLPFAPGVSSLSDIGRMVEAGCQQLKLFPAELSGGVALLKAISSIFPGVTFCPTGGVAQNNLASYLALGNVFAVGGSWIAPNKLVAEGNWQGISQRAAAAKSQVPGL